MDMSNLMLNRLTWVSKFLVIEIIYQAKYLSHSNACSLLITVVSWVLAVNRENSRNFYAENIHLTFWSVLSQEQYIKTRCVCSWLSHSAVYLAMARALTIPSTPQGATVCYLHSSLCYSQTVMLIKQTTKKHLSQIRLKKNNSIFFLAWIFKIAALRTGFHSINFNLIKCSFLLFWCKDVVEIPCRTLVVHFTHGVWPFREDL